MYRDDPLDDEMELREVIGDDAVDRLLAARAADGVSERVETAVDVLRLLVGWAAEAEVAAWFGHEQARLDGRSPVDALADGDLDEVLDAARAWAAARG